MNNGLAWKEKNAQVKFGGQWARRDGGEVDVEEDVFVFF